MAAAATHKLAALVTLLALLVGPSAGSSGSACFVGWRLPSLVGSVVCGLLGRPYTRSSPSPAAPTTGVVVPELSVGYYNNPNNRASYCPGAEAAVRKVVEDAINNNKYNPFGDGGRGIGAGLIRLFFHDAFVRGCDGSVLLNTTATGNRDTERTGPPNENSLRGFDLIDAAKEATKAACGGNKVSCADILAFAARDASDILSNGRIKFDMPAGRYDGRESFAGETNKLPGPDSSLQQVEKSFADQGLNRTDMVTLSAAHSIGQARCGFFTGRLPAMDTGYARGLNGTCNGTASPDIRVNQDNVTAYVLDNQYYKNIDNKFVLFGSDAALSSSETIDQVSQNVANASKWENDFAVAMVKMGKIGVKTSLIKDVTEIRELCWRVNDKNKKA
ncbi:Peroxidase 2 [Dichanthelium oligosanthes]|uniref:Peroxidase n=1 Tax=Dichanthelium oligosanthes TaxID=888268 RepID=A0A1E5VCM2_9POAL|nr:Peroxidase 2 [Dichanthelium oligosanthes]